MEHERHDAAATAAPAASKLRLGLAAGAIAGIVATAMIWVGGPGSATAQTPTPSQTAPADPGGPGPGFKRGHMRGKHGMGIHGEFVTRGPNGGFQTIATQVGEVTAVSASSITVKSEDGFSRTYKVDDNTMVNAGNEGIDDVKTGDTVHVVAIVGGGSASAVRIVDETQGEALERRWRPARPRPEATPNSGSRSSG